MQLISAAPLPPAYRWGFKTGYLPYESWQYFAWIAHCECRSLSSMLKWAGFRFLRQMPTANWRTEFLCHRVSAGEMGSRSVLKSEHVDAKNLKEL